MFSKTTPKRDKIDKKIKETPIKEQPKIDDLKREATKIKCEIKDLNIQIKAPEGRSFFITKMEVAKHIKLGLNTVSVFYSGKIKPELTREFLNLIINPVVQITTNTKILTQEEISALRMKRIRHVERTILFSNK